jgi:gliding motility-associated-like protein
MKKFVFIFFLIYASSGFAQNLKKAHYNILNPSFDFTLNYEKALSHVQVDGLRFLNQRRSIPIEGSKINIELYSAQELLSLYGKPISPLTVTDPANAPSVNFKFEANNYYHLVVSPNLPLQTAMAVSEKKQVAPNETITAFGTTLFDSGGLNGNYASNENYSKTIYSDNGEKPYLKFTSFNTENNFDVLYIYDGLDASAKLIGAYSGGNAPTLVQASGAYLTLVFTSDNSNTASGWAALVGRGTPPPPPSPMSSPTCGSADPFCTGTTYNFPATTGSTVGQTGPSYGCLYSQPNPAWYYLQIANPGSLTLNIAGSGGGDVDFICWGPFTSPTAPCTTGLTGGCSGNHACSGNIVDCSYSPNATENCTIPNAVAGQYYMVMITNYSNQTQNIVFNQTGGTGSTNCNIINCGVTASNTGPYCVGQTISLSAATTNTTATTYAWSGPNAFSATGQNVTIPNSTLAMSGTYSVTGTTGGTVTCVATTSVTVTANAPPTVNSPTICAGGTATLTAGPATSTFSWNTGDATATVTVSPTSTSVYTVIASVGSCTSTNTSTVTVVANPILTVTSGTICQGGSTSLTASGTTSYNWNPTTGISNPTNAIVTASPASTTVYTVNGTVGTCSATPVTTTVTVNPTPTVTATGSAMCAGQTATLTASGAATCTWTPAISLNPSTGPSVVASPSLTTTYTVVGTDANGCQGMGIATVTVNPLPTFTVNAPAVCVGQTLVIDITPGYALYSIPSIPYSSTNNQIQIPNATTAMANNYGIAVTSAEGCTNIGAVQVVINSPPTLIAAATQVCVGSTGTLTATGAGPEGTYTWNPGTYLNTTTGGQVLISPGSTAPIVYTIIGEDDNGCVNTATLSIAPNPLPLVSILPDTVKGCVPQCATYTANSTSATAYNWSFSGGQPATSGSSSPNTCFNTAGTYVIKLTLTDINGCVNTATATAITYPIPTADFDYAPKPVTILTPDVHFTNETYSTGATHYQWNFGDFTGGDTSRLTNPIYTYSNSGTYNVSLIATSANGCTDTIIKQVVIDPDYALYVPNAFTPNGDGKNEIFKATGEGILDFTMYVFDRWGNTIFTSTNMDIGWDGRRNNKGGELLQQDVYVWKIEVRNVNHQGRSYSGTVTLLR